MSAASTALPARISDSIVGRFARLLSLAGFRARGRGM
jgi:hypothetical protein